MRGKNGDPIKSPFWGSSVADWTVEWEQKHFCFAHLRSVWMKCRNSENTWKSFWEWSQFPLHFAHASNRCDPLIFPDPAPYFTPVFPFFDPLIKANKSFSFSLLPSRFDFAWNSFRQNELSIYCVSSPIEWMEWSGKVGQVSYSSFR